MRKAEKLALEMLEFVQAHACPVHGQHLYRHFAGSRFWPNEGCWDCPVRGCNHHEHENQKDSERWGATILPEHENASLLKYEGTNQRCSHCKGTGRLGKGRCPHCEFPVREEHNTDRSGWKHAGCN